MKIIVTGAAGFIGFHCCLRLIKEKFDVIGIDNINELILATSTTIEGEATAHYIREMGMKKKINISRLAFGLPLNGEISFLDNETISHAFNQRKII